MAPIVPVSVDLVLCRTTAALALGSVLLYVVVLVVDDICEACSEIADLT